MGLKWTLVFLLCLNISTNNGFDLRRVGGSSEGGYVDKKATPSEGNDDGVLKGSSSEGQASQIDPRGTEGGTKRFGEEDEGDDNPVEHPLPPRGPLSRIVVKEVDSDGKAVQKTVDLQMDSREGSGSAASESEGQKPVPLASSSDPTSSTSEKLEQGYEGKAPGGGEDKMKDLPLEKMMSEEESRVEKKELMDGVVNALHHQINGNRKAYFRNAVSLMSKEELDDLHDVLVKALKPLPDDDVKVSETQEELKEAVHELVEEQQSQGESSEVEEQKKVALIELEHVLEEVKPEATEPEVEEKKQVILKEDWKKEDIVGGIAQNREGPVMLRRNGGTPDWWKVTSTSTTTTPKPPPSGNVTEKVSSDDNKKDVEVPAAAASPPKDDKEKEPAVAAASKDEPVPEVVKEVVKVLDEAPDVPKTPQGDDKNNNDEVGEIKTKGQAPEDKAMKVDPQIMERIKDLSVIGGILGKDKSQGQGQNPRMEEMEDQIAEELPEEARVKEVFAETVIQPGKNGGGGRGGDAKGDDQVPTSRLSSKESEKDKEENDNDKAEEASELEQVKKSPVNCSAGPSRTPKASRKSSSEDEAPASSDEKGIADNLRRRGGANGRGWGPYGVTRNLRRNRRHSRTYYRRRPYPDGGEGKLRDGGNRGNPRRGGNGNGRD